MTATATPQLRWSSVRDCGRKAVLEATGAPARERTLQEERTLYRGRSVGHDFVVALANENRWKIWVGSGPYNWVPREMRADSEDTADVIAELKIAWALGTGHCDLYIRETDTVLEVLSSQHASADMIRSKLVQARGYAEGIDASSLVLAIVDPSTLVEERIVVTQTSANWTDLLDEVHERVDQVLDWNETGKIPVRVCGKPSEARGHFCLHAEYCFDGFQPDVAGDVESEEAQQLAIRLAHVKAKRREISSSDKVLEAEQKEIQGELGELVPTGEWQVGGYLVKRSDRSRSSFKLALAQQDSRIPGDLLDEFTSTSTYQVWDVEKTGPAVVVVDGDEDVPF